MHSIGRVLALWGLAIAVVLCWFWIVPMSRDMYGSMSGTSAWMMTPVWDAPHLLLLWLMWAVMMAAMMLPSATPLLLLYDGVVRRRTGGAPAFVQLYAMAAGYVLVWALFSVAAVALQRVLSRQLVLSAMMEVSS
ncbi:MAG: DUF2182 domain-containing protein, partial [Vicinamibacterales bacterium]